MLRKGYKDRATLLLCSLGHLSTLQLLLAQSCRARGDVFVHLLVKQC